MYSNSCTYIHHESELINKFLLLSSYKIFTLEYFYLFIVLFLFLTFPSSPHSCLVYFQP